MRYVDLKIRPDGRWFHPVDEHIAADPKLRHGPIHHINLLDDESAVLLYEIDGPKERVDELYAEYGGNDSVETTAAGSDTLVYTRIDPSPVVVELLGVTNRYSIVVDMPMEFTDDDELRVTLVGEASALQEAFVSAPPDAQVTVEKTGQYRPGTERLFADLTDRQRETLLLALELGYYDEPRQVTYRDIANELDCTSTTVGEHLRKVEGYVLRQIAPQNV